MDDCKGLFGKLFGHKFEEISDIKETATPIEAENLPSHIMLELLKNSKMKSKTYLFSQCKRCGMKINEK